MYNIIPRHGFCPREISAPPLITLGSVLGSAAQEQARNSNLPDDLFIGPALGYAGAALQDLYNVQLGNYPASPIGVYTCVVAGSGEGKDVSASAFRYPLIASQVADSESRALDVQALARQAKIRVARENYLIRKLVRVHQDSEKAREINSELELLSEMMADAPPSELSVVNDISPSGLMELLRLGVQSVCLQSTEASSTFKRFLGDPTVANAIWDGSPLKRDRVKEHSLLLTDRRLTMVLGLQPAPFERYLREKGRDANSIGLLPRMLISTHRPREARYAPLTFVTAKDGLKRYNERMAQLLSWGKAVRAQRAPRKVLKLDAEAAARYESTRNWLWEEATRGRFVSIPEYTKRACAQIVRIAAILHAMDDLPGDISFDTWMRAETIGLWYVHQFNELFSKSYKDLRVHSDSNVVFGAMRQAYAQHQMSVMERDLKFMVPHDWSASRLSQALRFLVAQQAIFRTKLPGRELFSLYPLSIPMSAFAYKPPRRA